MDEAAAMTMIKLNVSSDLHRRGSENVTLIISSQVFITPIHPLQNHSSNLSSPHVLACPRQDPVNSPQGLFPFPPFSGTISKTSCSRQTLAFMHRGNVPGHLSAELYAVSLAYLACTFSLPP
jgi:hypothetical protein